MEPAQLPGIERSCNLKILGIDIGHDFSISHAPCPVTGDFLHANHVCTAHVTGAGTQQCGIAAHLSDYRHCENDVKCNVNANL